MHTAESLGPPQSILRPFIFVKGTSNCTEKSLSRKIDSAQHSFCLPILSLLTLHLNYLYNEKAYNFGFNSKNSFVSVEMAFKLVLLFQILKRLDYLDST